MRFERLLLILSHIAMPVALIMPIWQQTVDYELSWWLTVVIAGGYLAYLFVGGAWHWFGVYWRYLWLFVWVGVVTWRYAQIDHLLFLPKAGQTDWLELLIQMALACLFLYLCVRGLMGRKEPSDTVHMPFPLLGDSFYVVHGGQDTWINYHYAHVSQKFALDIVKLNKAQIRATGFYPKALSKYAIFGEMVYSPVDGVVLTAVNHLPDLIPPQRDPDNPAGNYVAIQPTGKDYYILLAHLQKESLLVQTGDTAEMGQPLGRIGNSGNTTEPHLHIHCATLEHTDNYVTNGEGIAVVFNGRFLCRNDKVDTINDVGCYLPIADGAVTNWGALYHRRGDFKKAIAYYDMTLKRYPQDTITYHNRGLAYANQEMWQEAIQDFDKAIEYDPDYDQAYYYRGLMYYELEEWGKALTDYDLAIQLNPKNDDYYYERGNALREWGQLDKALEAYNEAIRLNPENDSSYYNRGWVYSEKKQFEQAIADYTVVIRLDKASSFTYNNRGRSYMELEKWQEALADLNHAVDLDPANEMAYANRAEVFCVLQRWDEALANVQKAMRYSASAEEDPEWAGYVQGLLEKINTLRSNESD